MSRYNHALTVAFEVVSDNDADNLTERELLAALYARVGQFVRGEDSIIEAACPPYDTAITQT